MNRRDLIIISALINAGLLVVLFATALKNDVCKEVVPQIASEIPITRTSSDNKLDQATIINNEVDKVLKEFAASQAARQQVESAKPSEAPQEVRPIATKQQKRDNALSPSFVEELVTQYPEQVTLPPPAQKKEEFDSEDFAQVRVENGDYLDKIARNNGTSVSEITRINHLPSTKLKIGQLLKVPRRVKQSSSPSVAPASTGDGYYVVQDGDNPWTIARKNQISVSELLRLNHLDDRSARRIKPGDRLRIR